MRGRQNTIQDILRQLAPRDNGCREWVGTKDRYGYGRCSFASNKHSVHRLVYEHLRGPVPEGLCVLHSCDNPACCNPSHLFLGTPADNAADRNAKGRNVVVRGENNGSAKLTEQQVIAILARCSSGISQRQVAREFGVSQTQVWKIMKSKLWLHIA